MSFITQGKTNWKFLVIVIILAIIVGGGALHYYFTFKGREWPPIIPPPKTEKEVAITTDKTEYEQGEIVKITVQNNTDKIACLESCNAYYLEKKNTNWEIDTKSMKLCIANFVGECLEPAGAKTFELKTALDSYYRKDLGTYRAVANLCIDCKGLKELRIDKTIYSSGFTIKESKIETSNEFLEIASPVPYQKIKSPVLVSGKSNFFEATTGIRIKDDNGKILVDTFTTAEGYIDKLYPFSKDVSYETPSIETGIVEVFEESPKDGSDTYMIVIPVFFEDYVDETADWKTSIKELGINLKLSNEFIEVFGLPYKSYEKEGKVGKAINFNFAMMNDYRGLMLTAYTSNYEPPLNETWAFNDWVGAEDVVKTCPKQLEYSSDRVCKIIEINEEKAVFETYLSFLEASCMFDVRAYFNNHSSSPYKGLNFYISLPDTSDKICKYYYLASEDSNSEALKSEFYTQSKNIMENKNLSEEDSKRLRLFEQMLSALKFSE